MEYFSYLVILEAKVEFINYSNPQVFPRVTLCNLYPVQSGSKLHKLYHEFESFRKLQMNCSRNCSEKDPAVLDVLKQLTVGVMRMSQFYGIKVMQEIGHQEVPFIVSCSKTYTSAVPSLFLPCNGTIKFTRHFHPELLNCYSTYIPMYKKESFDISPLDGLSFILFLDNLDLLSSLRKFSPHEGAKTAGVNLQLSPKMFIPFSSTESTLLNAGTHMHSHFHA